MKQVWKFSVPVDDLDHVIPIPVEARIVHVQTQAIGNSVELWEEHNVVRTARKRTFRVFGTGQNVPDEYTYVGTSVVQQLGLVWHLYERT